jgi:hypothetical protein
MMQSIEHNTTSFAIASWIVCKNPRFAIQPELCVFRCPLSDCAFLSRIHRKERLFAKILDLRFYQRLQRFSLFIFRIVLFFLPHNSTIWDGRVGTKTLANSSSQIETNGTGERAYHVTSVLDVLRFSLFFSDCTLLSPVQSELSRLDKCEKILGETI